MDTEEDLKIKKLQREGRPETDEGPYYHESWWEAYKGGVKGKLGGAVIGATGGALLGGAMLGMLAIAGLAATSMILPLVAGFAAAGMLYGAHEFSDVGKVTGAVAAAHEKSEHRLEGKFAELRQEIRDLKAALTGKKTPESAALGDKKSASDHRTSHTNYRTTHCDNHCPPEKTKLVFWKVAAIGAVVGLAAGALLVGGGFAGHILETLGHSATEGLKGLEAAAAIVTTGLFGASFGINRDLFRKVFDKTDMLFRGLFKSESRDKQLTAIQEKAKTRENPYMAKDKDNRIATVVYEGYIDYPASGTHWREAAIKDANKAFHSLDPFSGPGH